MEYSRTQRSYEIVPMKNIAPQNLKNAYFSARLYVWFMRKIKFWLDLIYDYGSSNQNNFYNKRYPEYLWTILGQHQCPIAHPFLEKVKKLCKNLKLFSKNVAIDKNLGFYPSRIFSLSTALNTIS